MSGYSNVVQIKKSDDRSIYVVSPYIFKPICQSIGSGKWSKAEQRWYYPIESLPKLLYRIEKVGGEVDLDYRLNGELERLRKRDEFLAGLLESDWSKLDAPEFLMPHQKLGYAISSVFDRFGFYYDTGTGKTILALSIMEKDSDMRYLVIAKKHLTRTAWLEDQRTFFPYMRLLPLSLNFDRDDYVEIAERWGMSRRYRSRKAALDELIPQAQGYLLNPEQFKCQLADLEYDGIIVDESSIFKSYKTQITKDMFGVEGNVKKLYLLSGNPAPNTPMEYWTQAYLLNKDVLGTSFFSFRNRFFYPSGYNGYVYSPKEGAEEEIATLLRRCSVVVKKEDCLVLPEKTEQALPTQFSDASIKKMYKLMEKEYFMDFQDETVLVNTKLASLMKLRQMADGFIYSPDGSVSWIHHDKINLLMDLLDDIRGQAIIWCQFVPEIEYIKQLLEEKGHSVVTAYGGTKDVDASCADFKSGEAKYLIAHPRTLMYGVTLTNCSYAIYYSMSHSYEEWYQSHDRIYRKGQTKNTSFYYLQMEKTIDEDCYKSAVGKHSVNEFIQSFLRRVGI